MRFAPALLGAFALFGAAGPAAAWGDLGHEVTALIAYRHLTPTARAKLDGLLTSDADSLTAPDFASRATWADKYRNGHRETSEWHFVDLEIDRPDLAKACSGFPRLMPGQVASAGPAKDCVIDKIEAFDAELRSPATAPAERLLALKFLVHFVGDLHQPLHASDHNDHGGNCIGLAPALDGKDNLHASWDTAVVEAMGGSASDIAARLNAQIAPADLTAWGRGDARSWAMESFSLSRRGAYALPSRPKCVDHAFIALAAAYQATAKADAAIQLEKAGVRIAAVLNHDLS